MAEGNNLVDYHGCDFFPERYLVMCCNLRTPAGDFRLLLH